MIKWIDCDIDVNFVNSATPASEEQTSEKTSGNYCRYSYLIIESETSLLPALSICRSVGWLAGMSGQNSLILREREYRIIKHA